MMSILTAIVLAIAVFGGFMYINQPGMIFFPIKDLHEAPSTWGMDFENLSIVTEDDVRLHAWFVPQRDSDKTLLFFHGNAGNISHRGDSIKIFHDLGLNVLIFDYRGYGQSEGKPTEAGLYKDARAAWNYLTQTRGISNQQIVLFGRSLGGVVAAKLATEVDAGAIILESTFSSARDMAQELFPILSYVIPLRFNFDSAQFIQEVDSPVLVIHSTEDEIIPYAQGRKIFEAANQPKQLLEISGDHNSGFLTSQPRYGKELKQFLEGINL